MISGAAVATAAKAAARFGRQGLDALIPPTCVKCAARVDAPGLVCGACWSELRFIAAPLCARCGVPFPYDLGPDALCAACAAAPPHYDRARAALVYDDACRPLVTRLKYGDHLEGAGLYARWIFQAVGGLAAEADVIAPVPLHPWRLLARRFNQSALLAQGLAKAAGRPLVPDLLVRTRPTRPQVGLTPAGRRRNVAHAFALRRGLDARVAGARILLVDDVMTTGATVEACAKVLRRAGAVAVDVATLARVAAGRTLPI